MEFFKIPPWHLDDDIIQGGFEKGTGSLGDLVFEFVEVIANGQLGCDLSDRVSGGFTGEC